VTLNATQIRRLFPFLRWWPRVDRTTLRNDAIAGAIGAVIVLPQGVAFASIAGMPLEYGLYAAIVPAIVAALFGSSWHLVSGPTTAASVVMYSALSVIAVPESPEYVQLAITLTFLVGIIQLVLGLARMGTLVNFISHTVIVGFVAGAAVLIATSQLKHLFGLSIPQGESFFRVLWHALVHWREWQPGALVVGAATVVAGLAGKKRLPKVPYMITALVGGAVVAALVRALPGDAFGTIAMVGALPGSLPPLSAPQFDALKWSELLPAAVAMTLLGLTEAISIARSVGLKSRQTLEPSQEFTGQGLSNIVGSFFSAYVATGSFNRTAANFEAGARTPVAALLAGVLLAPMLFVVAPLTAWLPKAAMSGLLLLIAISLFDLAHIRAILRASRTESIVLLVTFLAALFINLEVAILLGVLFSLVMYLRRTSRPRILPRVPDPNSPHRKFTTSPNLPECPQLKMVRIDDAIYFGAVAHIREIFQRLREHYPEQKNLLLLAQGVPQVDVAGAELLVEEAEKRRGMGGRMYVYRLKETAQDVLRQGGYLDALELSQVYLSKGDAIRAIYAELDKDICAKCTARIFTECGPRPKASPVRKRRAKKKPDRPA